MLRLASITTGVAELPQVLAMAELKVATSVLELPVVAPGAVGSPAQFADVDQVPLTVEPPSHVWLAANTLDGARTKTAMAVAMPKHPTSGEFFLQGEEFIIKGD